MTDFGKMLRKLRIDMNERLYDMAKKLGVSSAFLCAVEAGKKSVPTGWAEKIVSIYSLNTGDAEQLQRLADEATSSIRIDMNNASAARRSVAAGFARRFNDFSDDTLDEFRKLLEKKDDSEV